MDNEPRSGPQNESKHINEPIDLNCPKCGKIPVIWLERILVEGSLEQYHLMHTEVEDVYQCPACKHTWKTLRFL